MGTDWHELREQARRAEHEQGVVRHLEREVARLARVRDERAGRLAAEAEDVEALGEFSLAGLLERLFGTRAQRVEREVREQAEARLAFEGAKGEHARLAARLERMQAGAPARSAALEAFGEARARRAEELRARGGPEARRIEVLEGRLEAHARRQLELDEARALCTQAEGELQGLREALAEAWGAGAADLFAPGYHAERTAAESERRALNRAHAHGQETAVLLARLAAELADTGLRWEPRFKLPETLSVADWFLDGLLLDWLALRRTSAARERASEVLAAVQALGQHLQQAASALEGERARDQRLLEERLGG